MTDQAKQIEQLEMQVVELSNLLKEMMIQHAVDHNLLIALTYQCNNPLKLSADFETISERRDDNLLFKQITDDDMERLNKLTKTVGKQLPQVPQ